MKSRGGKSQSREEKKKEDQRRERVRRKKMQVREKVEKSRNTVFFQWSVALEARKVGSRVRSHLARWEMKNCTPLGREAHFRCQKAQSTPASEHFWKLRYRKSGHRCGAKHISDVKKHKAHQLRTTFGSWDVEKVDAAVAQSTFPMSKSTKHTSFGALWKLRYRKSGRRCGAKHISEVKKHKAHQLRSTFWSWDVEKVHAAVSQSIFPKLKSTKHTSFGALFEVKMSNKCTLSCREAHFKVKMCKTYHSQSTFGSWAIEKVHAVVARTHFKVEMYKTP